MRHARRRSERGQVARQLLVNRTMPHNPNRRQGGVTLIEVMTTVAVVIVLATVASGPFGTALGAMRMRSATSDLINDLVYARSEALKRGLPVAITPTSPGWSSGWRVGVVSGTEVLGTRSAVGAGIGFTTSPSSVTFDASGRLTGATSAVRFGLAASGGANRCVSIDPSGRPKSSKSACPA